MSIARRRLLQAALAAGLCGLGAACGVKGPLYLPEETEEEEKKKEAEKTSRRTPARRPATLG